MVADGNKQHDYIKSEDASLPTIALKSVLLTATIDAQEGWGIAIINVSNAFVQMQLVNKDNMAIMCLHGQLAELMIKTAPKVFEKFATKDAKGQTTLCICLLNALYGIMKAALLFYQCFVTNISRIGFIINPYDPCVMNKTVKDNQLTIVWHIDDLKVSHHNAYIVMHMACWLQKTYQCIFSDGSGTMKVSWEKSSWLFGHETWFF